MTANSLVDETCNPEKLYERKFGIVLKLFSHRTTCPKSQKIPLGEFVLYQFKISKYFQSVCAKNK